MAKRLFDIALSLLSLGLAAPFILFGAAGIKLTSPGPIFYLARRMGRGGVPYGMYKLRTMHVANRATPLITSPDDKRIFAFGSLLRLLKIDELPQFWNILKGDMSFVGPRPEAVDIVERHYTSWMRETLQMRPGVSSPGALYNYQMSDLLIDDADPEGSYVQMMLPPKLALERAYMERATFGSDIAYIVLTIRIIVAGVFGVRVEIPWIDIETAHRWAPQGPYPSARS